MSRIVLSLPLLLAFVLAALAAVKMSRRGPRRHYTSDRREWWGG